MEKTEMKENRQFKRLKGFQKASRARFLLLTQKKVTQEEFVLYELGAALALWDETKEEYGTFYATNQELSEILGWKSDTSALRHKKSLIKKGLFIMSENGAIEPKGYEKWRLRKQPANKQPEPAISKHESANIEDSSANNESVQLQNRDYPLSSFKDNVGLFNDNNEVTDQDIRDIEEIFEEYEEEGIQ